MTPPYPPARRGDTTELLHGVRVADPYRWLEDAGADDTRAWVTAQNQLTRAALDGPARDALVQRLTTVFDIPRSASPLVRGSRYFFAHNAGLQNQAVLYVQDAQRAGTHGAPAGDRRGAGGAMRATDPRSDAEPRVLIDPNAWNTDGTTALTAVFPSNEGTLLAYAVSHGGSDRQQIRILDVAARADLPDVLEWVKFASVAWAPGGGCFYYLRFPAPGTVPPEDEQYFGRIYLHVVGTPQADDPLVFEYPSQKEVVPLVDVSDDGRMVVITCQRGASDDSEIYVIETRPTNGGSRERSTTRALFTGFDAAYAYIASSGDRLLFRTTRDAEMGRIIAAGLDGSVADVVPETSDRLVDAVVARDALAAVYLHNASSQLRLFDRQRSRDRPRSKNRQRSKDRRIALPGLGTITSLDARADGDDVLFAFTSFTQPSTAYVLPPEGGSHTISIPSTSGTEARGVRPQAEDFVTRQVWFPSRDGTRVSMFLVHRDGLPRDGARPVLLSGYGGFNISRTPQFDPAIFPLLERDGVFALANLRGGGEYGEAWHQAGMLERKQNVFDDFIAGAEFLIAEGYTSPAHLAIEGGSNGGLLVGAVMVQRPDLFGAVICRVPVADMLRYHLFTVGRFWIPEYGSADEAAQFDYLLRYSPYHNIRPGVVYPPTLIMTADTDDRVDPGMAKKFAARLQAEGAGGPFLLRVETRAGHGAGKPVGKMIDEDADILAFLERHI